MNGWCGKIARIHLTDNRIDFERPDPALLDQNIGGRGLAGHYLQASIQSPWDDPAMPLLLFTGPLVGTHSPTSGRMTILSKSPLTGTIADTSVGGSLGTELKRAGLDGLVITGKCEELSGIEIRDNHITIKPVPHWRGKTTTEITTTLKAHGAVAAVGPAAENGVLFSSIIIDGHFAAGRSGIGLAFAAKNLKYLTVQGTGRPRVSDPQQLQLAIKDIHRLVNASPVLSGPYGISRFGTGALYDLMSARSMMPTGNFRESRFDGAPEMNAHVYRKRYQPRSSGCRGCHIRCKKVARSGQAIPEFETMSHFSALINNRDTDTVVAANRICNEMGMDTISAGATLACYAEIANKELTPEDICTILGDIARGRGEGKRLGRGATRYATACGKPELAMAVKQQELSAYDPRGAFGMALAFAVSTRGGCHLRAYPISHEILRKPVATDRFSFTGKARMIKISEDLNAVADSLTACKFIFFAATLEEYAGVYTAVTGRETTGQELLKKGERIYYRERMMNAANGFGSQDDDLPRRFFEKPYTGTSGKTLPPLSREDFLKARADYYKVRGLDTQGRPLREKIRALGLERMEHA